jgi:uncharacterized MnhB-related membrane protein
MDMWLDRSLRAVLIVGGTAILWLAVFNFNMRLFEHTAFSERAHWIFLPAAFRVIAVLIFGLRGSAGLMLGAYLTMPPASSDDHVYEIMLSISSGLAPLAAVIFCRHYFRIDNDLVGLNGWHVIALSVSCAAANAILLNLVMWLMGTQQPELQAISAIFVGDVLGAAIVLGAMSLLLSLTLRLMRVLSV